MLARFKVEGMHCASCLNRIENTWRALGADDCRIDLFKGFATLTYKGDEEDAERFVDGVERLGYKVTLLSTEKSHD